MPDSDLSRTLDMMTAGPDICGIDSAGIMRPSISFIAMPAGPVLFGFLDRGRIDRDKDKAY